MRHATRFVAASVLAVTAIVAWASPAHARPPADSTVTPEQAIADTVALGRWIVAYSEARWYEGIVAEQARRAAAARAASAPRGNTVGACTGFAIPDYIIQRESGGNPNAYNPSGAYGCAQTLLSHYSGGSCSGLDPYTIDGQRECVNRLSNGGTNLAPWAATR